MRRGRRDLDDALNRPGAALDDGAHALFLNGGQAAGEVAGADGILADASAVVERLVVGIANLAARLLIGGAGEQQAVQTDRLDDLLEDRRAALVHQPVVEPADDDVAGQAAGVVAAAAFRADDQVGKAHRDARRLAQRAKRLLHKGKAPAHGRPRTALVLDEEPVRDLALLLRDPAEPFRLDVFAAQADGQHGADIRMADEADEQVDGVLVVRAAVKAQQLNVAAAALPDDLLRDKFRAFDRVDDEHAVADALFAILAGIALPGDFTEFLHGVLPHS